MAWIESHTVLIRHRKVVALARALRLKPVYVLGHLHALWHVALEQQEDGDLSKWDDELIATYSNYSGDAPQYVRLLQEHGWLDGRLLHDWLDYAGNYLIARYHSSNRNRLCAIWKLHGCVYGRKEDSRKSLGSQQAVNSHSTRPNQTRPTRPNQPHPPDPPDGFDDFWTAYPKKKAKQDALTAWRKLKPAVELRGWIMVSLKADCGSEEWLKAFGKYIPLPASWLNGQRWEDHKAPMPPPLVLTPEQAENRRKALVLGGTIGKTG